MKLTRHKLEQLIMEEYVRRIGDEKKPTNYPEYADKLTTLAKSDSKEATSLADALDEPIDIEYDPSNMDYFPIDSEFGKHLQSPEHELHFDFLLWGSGAFSFEEEPDIGEVYQFSQELGLDPEETYKKIMKSYHLYRQNRYIKNNKFKSTDKRVPDTWFDREYKFYEPKIQESTGEQKRQQKRDNYLSREKQRRKIKAKIKRSQNKGESPFKSELPDFDPIKDLGKALKKRHKDLEVRANGKEIED